MSDIENKVEEGEVDTTIKPKVEAAKKGSAKPVSVTSTKSVDFPSLDWGINAGESRELPADKEAQKVILENSNISIIN